MKGHYHISLELVQDIIPLFSYYTNAKITSPRHFNAKHRLINYRNSLAQWKDRKHIFNSIFAADIVEIRHLSPKTTSHPSNVSSVKRIVYELMDLLYALREYVDNYENISLIQMLHSLL